MPAPPPGRDRFAEPRPDEAFGSALAACAEELGLPHDDASEEYEEPALDDLDLMDECLGEQGFMAPHAPRNAPWDTPA